MHRADGQVNESDERISSDVVVEQVASDGRGFSDYFGHQAFVGVGVFGGFDLQIYQPKLTLGAQVEHAARGHIVERFAVDFDVQLVVYSFVGPPVELVQIAV